MEEDEYNSDSQKSDKPDKQESKPPPVIQKSNPKNDKPMQM